MNLGVWRAGDMSVSADGLNEYPARSPRQLLAAALKIDDLRSTYCEQLELRIAAQAAEIGTLRGLPGLLRQP